MERSMDRSIEPEAGTLKPVIRNGGGMRSLEYTTRRPAYAYSAINSITHYFGRTDFALGLGDLYERWTMRLRH